MLHGGAGVSPALPLHGLCELPHSRVWSLLTILQAENAFGKLFDACCSKAPDESLDAGWMGTFNDTWWPQLLENALSVAAVGARAILAKRNVLVTGSTGNLTDAVVSSLIQVRHSHLHRHA